MNYCKHLKKRKNKPYCNLLKKEITLSLCQECVNKEYHFPVKGKMVKSNNHQITNTNKNKKKKVSHKKKKITVSKETYEAVIKRDNYSCRLIGESPCKGWLELHHILYRSQRKDLINDVNNCIMLCVAHHKLVHKNKKYWQPKLIELNKKMHNKI